MSAFIQEGARSWFKDSAGLWQPCTAGAINAEAGEQQFIGDNGERYAIMQSNMSPATCTSMHQTSIDSCEDMAKLGDLHEGAILYNIRQRYEKDLIYTFIGSILAAVNPYQRFPDAYSDSKILEYKGKAIGELAPHVYAISNEAYSNMWKNDNNQVVLISGESGSGKTETTKFMLRFLSYLSNEVNEGSSGKSFEEQIMQSNPILESVGNAKTVYNNNSSRFGKYMVVNFNTQGIIEGGKIIDYLLEKNRVVRQNPGERTFHIFYNIVMGGIDAKYGIKNGQPEAYKFTSQSGVTKSEGIDDVADWQLILKAFKELQFSDDDEHWAISVLASIIHLGEVTFTQAGGAQITNMDIVERVSGMLQLDATALGEGFTEKKRLLRGEVITTPLEVAQAADARDSFCMKLYQTLFKWICSKINKSLKGAESFHSIGILDIFGFENFEENFLEQFNINYANEKLQQYFNRHIFSLEQIEYAKEGLEWKDIDYVDNSECLDLIERKLGVISLIDEEARLPRGTDDSVKNKLYTNHGKAVHFVKPRVQARTGVGQFGIVHYAGTVMYEATDLVEKNRDTFRDDLLQVLNDSQADFILDLFEDEGGEADAGKGGRSTSKKKKTLCVQFKDSLTSLMKMLGASNPYFVRCVKPNMQKVPRAFEIPIVLNQLRYSGMMETVKIRRAGYPVRREFHDFLFRFRVLTAGMDKSMPEKDLCAAVFQKYEPTGVDWKIGHTKAFMREHVEIVLEDARTTELKVTIEKIKAVILGAVVKHRMAVTKVAIVKLQAWWKMKYYRKQFLTTKHSALRVQAHYRGHIARKRYVDLLELKYIQETRKAEVKRREEEERLAKKAIQEEQARLDAVQRAEEIRRAEKVAELAAKENAAAAEAAKVALAEAKAKAAAEAEAAAEAAAAADKENEERKKAEADAEAAAKAAEEASDKDAVAKAMELAAAQDEAAAKRAEAEAQEKLNEKYKQEMEAAAAKAEAEREDDAAFAASTGFDEEEEEFDDEDEEEEDDDVMEYREGFLGMFRGMMKALKKRWCVLHEGTFMWFKGQQNFIKAGWLSKMGGGSSTFGRANWKRRWMTLKGGELFYHETEEDDAKVLGIVDIQGCEQIVNSRDEEIGIKKEFCFAINTKDGAKKGKSGKSRTYFMSCESQEECDDWCETLNSVAGKTDDEIREMMMTARVDPRNAQGTIEADDITSVSGVEKTDAEGHPVFIVETQGRVEKFIAADADDMDDWIRVLKPTARAEGDEDEGEVSEEGWMFKGGGEKGLTKKRRYFVLRGEVLHYYAAKNDPSSLKGTIPLNALCSVVPPEDEKATDWTFAVHSRRKSFVLSCKTQSDMNTWINAIQDVVDNSQDIETPTERLIDELKMASPPEVEAIYGNQKVLTFQSEPLRAPLLPLPYGETTDVSGRQYGTLQVEALKMSVAFLPVVAGRVSPYGDIMKDPVALIRSICQACFDVPKLRNEVYCQVIKLTTNFPEPGSPLNLHHWYLLGALCSSFLPSRKFVRFLRFHLRRTTEQCEANGDDVVAAAQFCLETLKKTKVRDFPPSTAEVRGIMNGTGLECKVYCVGGKEIDVKISSSSTCADVLKEVKVKLKLESCSNGFGLFETCGIVDKYLEEKAIVADVYSKWEKYEAHQIGDTGAWKLVFKLFSFYNPLSPTLSGVEQEFLFEQAFDSVMSHKYPANEKELLELAALRTQYTIGDYEDGAYITDLMKVHPAQQPQLLNVASGSSSGGTIVGTLKSGAKKMFRGTLRGFSKGTLKKLKAQSSAAAYGEGASVSEEELAKIKDDIKKEWMELKGMQADDARKAFMEKIQSWNGYGANLFEVSHDMTTGPLAKSPKELWLAISAEGVGLFPRGERKCLAMYSYEAVLSFGAPVANKYKIMIDQVGGMIFETNMVLEIAKLMKEYIKNIVAK
jgi:myosin X